MSTLKEDIKGRELAERYVIGNRQGDGGVERLALMFTCLIVREREVKEKLINIVKNVGAASTQEKRMREKIVLMINRDYK